MLAPGDGERSAKHHARTTILTRAPRLLSFLVLIAASAVATAFVASAARAGSCDAFRSQLLSNKRNGGVSPEVAALRRQLAAIQAIERRRGCTAASAQGGFFNACADLARSRSEVQGKIASAVNSGSGAVLQARVAAPDCAARQERPTPKKDQAASVLGGGAMVFCVRPSDGYFFPAPKSQFAGRDDVKAMADQCRYICDDPTIELYTLGDPSLETDQRVAIETREPYTELAAAFKYRENADFKACDVKRYHQRVAELRARTVTPTDLSNAVIPLPTAKPEVAPSVGSESRGAAQASIEAGQRPVRLVGPAFFPTE